MEDECEYNSDDDIFFGPVTDAELRARAKKGISDNDKTLDFSYNMNNISDDEIENKFLHCKRHRELSNKKQPFHCQNQLTEEVDFSLISNIDNSFSDSLGILKDDSSPVLLKGRGKYVESTPMIKVTSISADSLECKSPKSQDSLKWCNMVNNHVDFKECNLSETCSVPSNESLSSNIHYDLMLEQIKKDNFEQIKDFEQIKEDEFEQIKEDEFEQIKEDEFEQIKEDEFEQIIDDELEEEKIDSNLNANDMFSVVQISSQFEDTSHCQESKSASELLKNSLLEGVTLQNIDSVAPSSIDTSISNEVADKVHSYSTSSTLLVDENTFFEQESKSDTIELLSVSKLSALHDIQEAAIFQHSPENNMENSCNFEEENITDIQSNVSILNEISIIQPGNFREKSNVVGEQINNGNHLDNVLALEEGQGQMNASQLPDHGSPSPEQGTSNILKDSGFHDISITGAVFAVKQSPNTAYSAMEDINCSENSDIGTDTSTKDSGSLDISNLMDVGENTLNVTNFSVCNMPTICKEIPVRGIDVQKLDFSQNAQAELANENSAFLKINICLENEYKNPEVDDEHKSGLQNDDNSSKGLEPISNDAAEEYNAYMNEPIDEEICKEVEECESVSVGERSQTVLEFNLSNEIDMLPQKSLNIDSELESCNSNGGFCVEDESNRFSQQMVENYNSVSIDSHDVALTKCYISAAEHLDAEIKAHYRSGNFILADESIGSTVEEYISDDNVIAEDMIVSYEADLLQEAEVNADNQENQMIYDNTNSSTEEPEECNEKENNINSIHEFQACDENFKLEGSIIDLETANKNNDFFQLNLASENAISNVKEDISESLREFEDAEKNCLLEELDQKDNVLGDKDDLIGNDSPSIDERDKSNFIQEEKTYGINKTNLEFLEPSYIDVETQNDKIYTTHEITNHHVVSILVDNTICVPISENEDLSAEDSEIGIQNNIYDGLSFQDNNQSKNEDMGLTKMINDFEPKSCPFENKIGEDVENGRVVHDAEQCFKFADFSVAEEITMQDGTCFIQEHDFDTEKDSEPDISNVSQIGSENDGTSLTPDFDIQVANEDNKLPSNIINILHESIYIDQHMCTQSVNGAEVNKQSEIAEVVTGSAEHKELQFSDGKEMGTKDISYILFSQDSLYEQNEMAVVPVHEICKQDLSCDADGLNHHEDLIGNLNENEQESTSANILSPNSDITINSADSGDSMACNYSANGSLVGNENEESLTVSFLEQFESKLKISDQSISVSNTEHQVKEPHKKKTFSANFTHNTLLELDVLEPSEVFDINGLPEISNTHLIDYIPNEKTSSYQETGAFGDFLNIDGLKIQDKSCKSVDLSCMSNICLIDELSFNEENRLKKLQELSVDDSSFVSNSTEHSSKENSMSKNESFDVDQITKRNEDIAQDILDRGISLIEGNSYHEEKTDCLLETSFGVANDDPVNESNITTELETNKDFPLVSFESPCITDDCLISQVSLGSLYVATKGSGNHLDVADNFNQREVKVSPRTSNYSPSLNFKPCDKLLNNLLSHTPSTSNPNFSSSSLFNSDSKLHEQSFNIAEMTQLLNNTCNTSRIEDEVISNGEQSLNDATKLSVTDNSTGISLLPLSDVFETEVRSVHKGSHVTMRPSSLKRLSSTKRTVKVINADGMVSEILNSGQKLNPSTAPEEGPIFIDDIKKKLFENDEDFIKGEELDLDENLDVILARMSSSPIKKCTSSKSQNSTRENLKNIPIVTAKKENSRSPIISFKKPTCGVKPHLPFSFTKENIPAKKNFSRFGISKTPNEKPKKTSAFLTQSLNPQRFCKRQVDAATSSKNNVGSLKKPIMLSSQAKAKPEKRTPVKSDLMNAKNLITPSKANPKADLPQSSTLKSVTKNRFGFRPDQTPTIESSFPKKKVMTPKRYLNVQSPVGKYIQETPVTPLIQNVRSDKRTFTMPKTNVHVKVPSQEAWKSTKVNTPTLPPAKYTTKIGNKPIVKSTPVESKPILKVQNIPAPVVTKHIGTSKVIKGCNYLINEESLLDTSEQPKALQSPRKLQLDMDATLVHEIDIVRSNTLAKGLKMMK